MEKGKNGIMNVDTRQMEEMRQQVVEQELSARSWKAYYDKMYFSMEAEKLEEPYREYQKRMQDRLQKEKAQMEEFLKTMKEAGKVETVEGALTVEPTEDPQQTNDEHQTPVIQM